MTLGRNDVCWCGSGKKYKACHLQFDDKIAGYQRKGHIVPEHNIIKTPEQIQGIKDSSVINIAVLDYLEEVVKEGMTTEEINHIVYQMTVERGGIPAPLDYQGYPKSVCTSIDEVVCHGIPSKDVVLKSGDIVNIDVSTEYKGFFSDSSRMFLIGEVSEEKKKLVRVTKECVELGLQQVKPWGFLGDVAAAINEHAMENGYSVVVEIGGHGIGLEFHEEPFVNYVAPKGTEMLMVPGTVFTIEPMVNMGSSDVEVDENDGWTVYTKARLPSAQWEITVAVTETGYEVLTY